MKKLHVKKGDKVKILVGKDRGKTGAIIDVLPLEEKVVVEGLNVVKRHIRRGRGKEAGIVEKPMPIHVSNVVKQS